LVEEGWERVNGELEIESEDLTYFNINPEGKSLYYTVMIFKNKKEMTLAAKKIMKWLIIFLSVDFDAIFIPVKIRNLSTNRVRPQDGFILFNKRTVTQYTVSHEMFHATLSLMRRKKMKFDFDDEDIEERAAEIQGSMCSMFWRTYTEG
jgi:hypothetical protein